MFKKITSFIIALLLVASIFGIVQKPTPTYAKKNHTTQKSVSLNKKFCIKLDETKKIKNTNAKITLDNYYKATGYYYATLKVGNKKYVFDVVFENGKSNLCYAKYIPDYKISAIKAKGKKLYLKVSKRKNIPKAMSISGNASDHYETKKYEYLESDNIILFMDKGIKFDGNILIKYEEQLKEVEKLTGLKRTQKKCNYETFCGTQQYVFGSIPFDGVDYKDKKLHVYVHKTIHPHCFVVPNDYGYFLINDIDLDVNNNEDLCNAFIHESVHYLHSLNGPDFNSILNEGYAAYNEVRALKKYQNNNEEDRDFYDRFGYTLKKNEVTEKNAEYLFTEKYKDTDRVYPYGFAFVTYLHETYGEKAFVNLFSMGKKMIKQEKKKNHSTNDFLSGKGCAKLLKKKYSKTIFKDFAKWLNNNPQYISEY